MSIWTAIEKSIQVAGHTDFSLADKKVVTGGDISQAFAIGNGYQTYFVKINSHAFLNNFQQEVTGLKYLAHCHQFVIPKVISIGSYQQQCFLVLEYLQLSRLGNERRFAESLAALHQITNKSFGFEANNFIGASPQINAWSSNWSEYFVDYRLRPQVDWLLQKHINPSILNQLKQVSKKLLGSVRCFLEQHTPSASLVHGDLWQGNYAFDKHGNPVLYDPACYFADREVDIAMLEMFGSPCKEFYSAYEQIFPRLIDTDKRKKIYNLYHLLNHANLFEGGYIKQVVHSVNEILELL